MKEVRSNECLPIFIHKPGGSGTTPGGETPGDTPSEEEPGSKLKFEQLASINNKDHNHPISATCIQFNENGDKAYVSWHKRGEEIRGCIEVVGIENNKVELLAYAEDGNNDYNHIFYDKQANRIITVGHNRRNAIIGEIPLTNDTFENNAELKFTTLKGNRQPGKVDPEFYGGDGNCVIRNGAYIQVASHGGLHTLNATDFSRLNGDERTGAAPTSGSCKHLSIDEENKIVAELHLTSREKNMESSPAELRWFSTKDHEWNDPKLIAENLIISPVDGKNTIALDGNSIYVCLSKGGVRKYDLNGTKLCEFTIKGNFLANGLAVDDKYLYIACGGNGLVILNKNNFKEIDTYKNKNGKSCNYVAVKGDLLYLAYGESGVDIVRMSPKQ